MIGFDLAGDLRNLRKNLLCSQQIFTGEAKPNTIRLLPSLALRKKDADEFLEAIEEEISCIVVCHRPQYSSSMKNFISADDVTDIDSLVGRRWPIRPIR